MDKEELEYELLAAIEIRTIQNSKLSTVQPKEYSSATAGQYAAAGPSAAVKWSAARPCTTAGRSVGAGLSEAAGRVRHGICECYCTRRYLYDTRFSVRTRRLGIRELDDLTTTIDY